MATVGEAEACNLTDCVTALAAGPNSGPLALCQDPSWGCQVQGLSGDRLPADSGHSYFRLSVAVKSLADPHTSGVRAAARRPPGAPAHRRPGRNDRLLQLKQLNLLPLRLFYRWLPEHHRCSSFAALALWQGSAATFQRLIGGGGGESGPQALKKKGGEEREALRSKAKAQPGRLSTLKPSRQAASRAGR
mgnify:CR=1 FL=1